jgi:hypothetical protein
MAYAIIAGLFVAVMGWAVFMSRRSKGGHVDKFAKPNFRGPVRRFPVAGKKIVQTDEQRSEVILANRDQYDPTIDLLDPRHKNYKGPSTPSQ